MKLLKETRSFVQPELLGDLVSGIKADEDKFISETLVTHKHSNLKRL